MSDFKSEKFAQLRTASEALKAKISSPETRAKAAAAAGGVMAGLVQGIGLLAYTAVSGVLSAKDGVVDALHDNSHQKTSDQK
jgi:hypothetical protein